MTTPIARRRTTSLLAGVLAAGLTLTGCASTDPGAEEADTETAASDSLFPVTIEAQHGEITVEEKPETIVVLTQPYADVLTSLGETFVFGSGYRDEELELQYYPWLEDRYTEYDAHLVTADWAPAVEAIAAHEPDLIFAYTADETIYDQLSQIAPVYWPASGTYAFWEEPLHDVGLLTGKSDEAAQVASDLEAAFADAKERLSGLQGATFNAGYAEYGNDGNMMMVPTWLADLGLVPAENQPAAQGGTEISAENLDQLEGDVVSLSYYTDEGRAAIEDDPRYAQLPAVQNGTFIWADDQLSRAITMGAPSAVLWALDEIVPQLEQSALNQSAG